VAQDSWLLSMVVGGLGLPGCCLVPRWAVSENGQALLLLRAVG
jgi:hypothetical protein